MERLWRLATFLRSCRCNAEPEMEEAANLIDRLAIRLAKQKGKTYADYDHEKCSEGLTAEDLQALM